MQSSFVGIFAGSCIQITFVADAKLGLLLAIAWFDKLLFVLLRGECFVILLRCNSDSGCLAAAVQVSDTCRTP